MLEAGLAAFVASAATAAMVAVGFALGSTTRRRRH
jgi:hypothetical protein